MTGRACASFLRRASEGMGISGFLPVPSCLPQIQSRGDSWNVPAPGVSYRSPAFPQGPQMRYLAVLLLVAASAMGSAVGDSYDKVIEDNGKPKNQMVVGAMKLLDYGDFTVKLKDDVVVSVKTIAAASRDAEAPAPQQLKMMTGPQQAAAIDAELTKAVDRIVAIVNQPVPTVPLTPSLQAGMWTAGWFHPGSVKPDFRAVDVRRTQHTEEFSGFTYVTSNLNPGVAFPGNQVEFNPMIKFFYKDYSLPKKRLTMEEMVEINRLYRVIAKCAEDMDALNKK
jgi:hypothetical protein